MVVATLLRVKTLNGTGVYQRMTETQEELKDDFDYIPKTEDILLCPTCHTGRLTTWFEANEAHQYVEYAECSACGATFSTK